MQLRFLSTKTLMIGLLIIAAIMPACASRGGKTFNSSEVRQAQTVSMGTVIGVETVMVEDDPSGLGTVVGGVAGGVLGSLIGGGRGRVLTTVGGAAAGALIGTGVESQVRKYQATQITVELDNGGTVIIVQGDDEIFMNGDRVRVISSGEGRARVQRS